MSNDYEVIILGAGVAGLSAAVELASAGRRITIIEARDRAGGRIFTKTDPILSAPVELGAEFIHGLAPEIWQPLQHRNIPAREVEGDLWCVRNGELCSCDFFDEVEEILSKMDGSGPDESFSVFLERAFPNPSGDPKLAAAKEHALGYVSGFNAADPALVSTHWLVHSMRADELIEGDRAFRIDGGYQTLVEILCRELNDAEASVRFDTVAQSIAWRAGRAEVKTCGPDGNITIGAPRVLVTVPLGVLQAGLRDRGALHFAPALPSCKQKALGNLVMGKVIRVTLCFRRRFWENLRPPGQQFKTLGEMSFLFSQNHCFPTWWTQMPKRLPIITGWAPADSAERLSGQEESYVIDKSLETLGHLLKLAKPELEGLLQTAYLHDWQNDPFSRGAYSYVRVGGDGAQSELAAPVEDTLFFAGEATDVSGHNGTVHGAIASGKRAAQEILRSLR